MTVQTEMIAGSGKQIVGYRNFLGLACGGKGQHAIAAFHQSFKQHVIPPRRSMTKGHWGLMHDQRDTYVTIFCNCHRTNGWEEERYQTATASARLSPPATSWMMS